MNLDIQTEGAYSQRTEDLMHLRQRQNEYEVPAESPNEHAVLTFKALAIILGVFFSAAAVLFMDAQMAFISVTLILIASFGIFTGCEKIITIFPARIWAEHSKNR